MSTKQLLEKEQKEWKEYREKEQKQETHPGFPDTPVVNTVTALMLWLPVYIVLSSAVKPGTHFLENNKVTGVITTLKLCVSKERLAQ